MLPPGWTVAATEQGARSFDLTLRKGGKPVYKRPYTVAADGKTMTQIASAPGINEGIKIVYARQ